MKRSARAQTAGTERREPGFLRLATMLARLATAGRRMQGAVSAVLILAASAMESLRLVMLVPIIDLVQGRHASPLWQERLSALYRAAHAESEFGRLAVLIALFATVTIARSVIGYARDVRATRMVADVVGAERARLAERLAAASWQRVATVDHARVTNMIGIEAPKVGSSAQQLLEIASNLVLLLFQLAIACALAPMLALALIAMATLAGVAVTASQRAAMERGRRAADANRMLLGVTARLLAGLKAAIAQDAQGGFRAEFARSLDDVRCLQLEMARARGRRGLWLGIGSVLAGGAIVLIAIGAFDIRLAVLLTTMFTIVRMSQPAMRIARSFQTLAVALPGYRMLVELEEELGGPHAADPVEAEMPRAGAIELDRASYRHPGGGGVTGASLRLEPGDVVGIVGPSGHGKTTLVDLVAGLLDPVEGMLRVGGDDVLAPPLRRGWRRQIGYVPQDCFMFNDTLRANLAWGSGVDDDATLLAAIEAVGAGPLLNRLGGLDHIVGERGALLSGGERQRIAIARAVLRRPRLLLLDEATSGLDPDSEAAIVSTLRRDAPAMAMLIVSHREATVRLCDRIVAVRDGWVADVSPTASPPPAAAVDAAARSPSPAAASATAA